MNEAISDLMNRRVTVWSVQGDASASDTGTLEKFDYPFIRVKKGDDVLVFAVHHIRLIKLAE